MIFLVGLVIMVIGIVLMINYPLKKSQNKRRSAAVTATCVSVVDKGGEDDEIRYYGFTYVVGGKQYMVSNLVGIPGDPKVGDQVPFCYNPKRPQDAGYDFKSQGKEHYFLYVGLGVFVVGIICMII